jgi:hypothetical protein
MLPSPRIFLEERRNMPATAKEFHWPALAASGGPRLGRTARITAHLFGWPLLIKLGLLTGFGLAAAIQQLLAVWR